MRTIIKRSITGLLLVSVGFLAVRLSYAATGISYGQTLTGSISAAGEKDEFTFNGTSGDAVAVRLGKTAGSWNSRIELVNSTNWGWWSYNRMNVKLPSGGQWKITVRDNNSTGTGSYGLTLQRTKNPVGATALSFGQPASGNVTLPSQLKPYTISASAGENIALRWAKTGGAGQYVSLETFDPDGSQVNSWYGGPGSADFKANKTGTYTVMMSDYAGNATESFDVYTQSRKNPSSSTALAPGQSISGSLLNQLEMDVYTITASAGDTLVLNTTRGTVTTGWMMPYLELCDVSGNILAAADDSMQRNFPAAGTYRVFFSTHYADSTGTYSISLQKQTVGLAVYAGGPYEVYGINVLLDTKGYLNISAHGATKLGEANTTKVFNVTNSKFFVVATRSMCTLDAIRLPDGKYLRSNYTLMGNLHKPFEGVVLGNYSSYIHWDNIFGPPDNLTEQMGFSANQSVNVSGIFKGYVAVNNPWYIETMDGCSPHQAHGGDPVILHNGDFVYTKTDISIPCLGMPLEVTRVYKSLSRTDGAFGSGWDMNYRQRIVPLMDKNVYWYDGTGKWNLFRYADGVNFTPPAYLYETLKKNADNTWTITHKDKSTLSFDANGCLSLIRDRNGNTLSLTYSSAQMPVVGVPLTAPGVPSLPAQAVAYDWQLTKVTAAGNRSLTFAYNSNGRLSSITDFTGRVVAYNYDTNGDLVDVTYPATEQFPYGTTIRYSYLDHKMQAITDAKGQVYLENSYDEHDRVQAQTSGGGTTWFDYNTTNKATTVNDAQGNMVVYLFNDNGLPVRKEEFTRGLRSGDPASYAAQYQYNSKLEKTREYLPGGSSIVYGYDAKGNLLNLTRVSNRGEANITSRFSYEGNYSFVKNATDPRGKVTSYIYDYEEAGLGDQNGDGLTNQSRGNLVKIKYPAVGNVSAEAKYVYNSAGQMIKSIDANNITTQYSYNSTTGYLLSTTEDPAGLNITKSFSYDSVGNVKTVKDPLGQVSSFSYDSHNNLLNTTAPAPLNYTTVNTWDANDNLVKVERATGNSSDPWQVTEYAYDELDRVVSVKDDLGQYTNYSYDLNGNKNSVWDANGNVTGFVYDERNLLWKATDALNQTTEYSYDANGNLAKLKDPRGYTTSYGYDGFDRLNLTTYPDGKKESSTYDAASNLLTHKDGANQTVSYTYDNLGRVTTKAFPGGNITYGYDTGSRMTSMKDALGTISYSYDKANRVTQVVVPGNKTVKYGYDKNSNRINLTWPDNTAINYTYDQINRLTRISQGNQTAANYSYDGLSQRTKTGLGNGMEAVYSYDGAGRLTKLVNRQASAPANITSQFNYTYDKAGNRKTMGAPTGTHTYTYDNTYQLKKADYPAGFFMPDMNFTFDAAGNRVNTVSNSTVAYTSNNLNQYTRVGSANHTYDANGNLKNDGVWTYTYDYENRLTKAAKTGYNATYKYDALGRRVEKNANGTVTKYVYDGAQVLFDTNSTGAVQARYIYGPGIDEPVSVTRGNQTYYYHYDGLGSVSEVTDGARAVKERYSYDAYGRVQMKGPTGTIILTSGIGNRFMYTGREYDAETGLYHYRARTYSPALGRFLQRDPIGFASDINRYRYTANNPLIYIDPYGTAYFAEKPLVGEFWIDGISHNFLDDYFNTDFAHEQIFFEDAKGGNIGFTYDEKYGLLGILGVGKGKLWSDPSPKNYRTLLQDFDDELLRQAVANTPLPDYQVIWFGLGRKFNCQDWAQAVRNEYERLKEKRSRKCADPKQLNKR